jgi:hypothetical protein
VLGRGMIGGHLARGAEFLYSMATMKFSVLLPTCRHCGRSWMPDRGRTAQGHYCVACSVERRSEAVRVHGLRPLSSSDTTAGYLLPARNSASSR